MPDDGSASGRASRASGISARTRPQDLRGPNNTSDLLGTAAPGVMSMLRTTTDIGDVGSLAFSQNRLPKPQRKRLHPSRMSDASMSNSTRIPKRHSNNLPWEGSSSGRQGSVSSLQTTKTMPSYYNEGIGPPPHPPPMRGLPPNPSPGPPGLDGRSYSMTQPHGQPSLALRRSASSLRSQASTNRMQRHRQPYPPPSRRPPPSFRSVSPAISDYNPAHAIMTAPHGPRPMRNYPGDFCYGRPHPPDMRPRYPPPASLYPQRQMHPPIPMHGYDRGQYGYPPPSRMHGPPRQPVMYPPPLRHGHGFHPGALPSAYEPTPPSSGPSSSAPHSSNPSTPQDSHQLKVSIASDSVEPEVGEILADNGEQAVYSNYIAYASKAGDCMDFEAGTPPFELEAELETQQPEHDIPGAYPTEVEPASRAEETASTFARSPQSTSPTISQPSTQASSDPPGSLVQRIKHLLENKAEAPSVQITRPRPHKPSVSHKSVEHQPALINDAQDPDKNVIGRAITMSDNGHEAKITRDLIKAMTCPSPTKLETLHSDMFEPKRIFATELVRSSSEYPSELGDADYAGPFEQHDDQHHDVSQMERSPSVQSLADNEFDTPSAVSDAQSVEYSPARSAVLDHDQSFLEDDVGSMEEDIQVEEEDLAPVHLPKSEMPPQPVTHADPPSAVMSAPLEHIPIPAYPLSKPAIRQSIVDMDTDEVADSNAGVTSDIVTDIAVRFSIPRQSSITKASIIRVSSTSERPQHVPQLHQDIFELPSTTSPRGSLYATDSVLPLHVQKQQKAEEGQVTPGDASDLSSFIRRSYPRRQSVLFGDKSFPSDLTSAESTIPVPGRLPDVKEESTEEIANIRAKSAIVTSISDVTLDSKARAHLSLSGIRDLPSLNFSQVNFIDQLNAALEDRSSFEVLRKRVSTAIASPSPLRPASTEALRERYTSFFARPESFHVPVPTDDSESFSVETLMANRKDEQQRRLMLSNHQDKMSITSKNGRTRSLSPSELLGLASDANRLSIPSVSGLTDRLSELLPSLKRLHLDSLIDDKEAVDNTIDEIHQLGQRPLTVLSNRSSGVLRSLAALADDIATNGTHASTVIPAPPRLNKSLPPLPQNVDNTEATITTALAGDETLQSVSGSPNSHQSAKRRIRRTQSEHRASTPALFHSTTSQTRRSLTVSSPNSRPWNFDENYPWSADTGLLTIEFPLDQKSRESITSHMLREAATTPSRNDRTIVTTTSPSTGQGHGASDGSGSYPGDFDPTATVTADTLTLHTRKLSKKAASLLGSLSRRAKLPSPARSHPSTETLRRPRTARPGTAGTVLSSSTTASRPHAVGDRYPSTALQAPAGYDIDEARSYFSDEEADSVSRRRTRRGSSLKKRLSGIRFKTPDIRVRPATTELEMSSALGFSAVASDPNGDTPSDSAWMNSATPTGMGRVEFTIKRLGERVRVIWVKGGILLRRVSGRAKRERLRREREWVDESGSVYSAT